ncbi:MAG: Mrp/NBP35 family ATP-binding protein [Candidatus Odinarchaeia archaeon]
MSEQEIINALKNVVDPELKMDIVSLGMVKDISIDEDVNIKIALTSSKCPLKNKILDNIIDAVSKVTPKKVFVEFTTMSSEEAKNVFLKARDKPKTVDKFSKNNIKKIFGVISAKGGVGKSLVTSLLAVELARRGLKIGVLDADITGSSIPIMFGIKNRLRSSNKLIIPTESKFGVKIVSMNLIVPDKSLPVIWRGPLINRAVTQFYSQVEWGELDVLLIDHPPGTSDVPLTVFQNLPIDSVIIVTTPQDLVQEVVVKSINMAKMMGVSIMGIIENMSFIKCPNCGEKINLYGFSKLDKISREYDIPILDKIELDPKISMLVDDGLIEEHRGYLLNNTIERIESMLK